MLQSKVVPVLNQVQSTSALDGGEWSALPPGKRSQNPLDRRLDQPQSWSGYNGKEKENPCPAGN